jgi:hypothetical protein
MLQAVPDLRPALATSDPDELADLFEVLDVVATYDKENRKLRMEAVITPELVSSQERPRPPEEAVGEIFHSGGTIWTH